MVTDTHVSDSTGTEDPGEALALLFAAGGHLEWSHTTEEHHEKRHHGFQKLNRVWLWP